MTDHTPSDSELLHAWRGGSSTAAAALIGRYGPKLFNFFATKVSTGADDLCQQTLADCIAAHDAIEESDERSFRGFLFMVARRRLLNHFRSWTRNGKRLDPLEHSVVDVDPGISEVVAARERQQRLHIALRQLPVDFQIALELHYWEGLTTVEIARVVEAPEGTVKARLARGRRRLEDLLSLGGVDEAAARGEAEPDG